MSVSTGRYEVRLDGQVVPADVSWDLGPAIDSVDVSGATATVTWHQGLPVSSVGSDWTTDVLDGQPVTVDWVDGAEVVRVFTGTVDSTARKHPSGEWTSRLSDGTRDRLTRTLDLHPTAAILPVNARFSSPGDGGRARYVGLHGVWFTHQAMTQAGYDPGVPMHWSSVWYQSMCGSIATVPGRFHAWAPLGDLRQASALSDTAQLPRFVQGDSQVVAADVYALGSTSRPRPGTENLPWQVTVDMGLRDTHPLYGSAGEVLLRHAGTTAGVALVWDATHVRVQRHTSASVRTTYLSVPRDKADRWSLVLDGTTARLRSNLGADQTVTVPGLALPTGRDGMCLVRVQSPGVIGPVAVTRGNRSSMVERPPAGIIRRGDQTGFSLPGWLYMPDQQAGRVLTDQADAHRGLRGQPIWSWIDPDGVLQNTDFDTLVGQPVGMTFDVRPGTDALALDTLEWHTDPPGGPWPAVEVRSLSARVLRRSTASLLLTDEPSRTHLAHGDEYEAFLQPKPGEAWLEPDLRPKMAGFPYPSPPYPEHYKHDLQRAVDTWLGGSLRRADSGDPRGWLQPKHLGWRVNATGHVTGALEMLTPDRVLVKGVVDLPAGHDATTMPHENSSLSARRREQALPQLRGYGLIRTDETAVTVPIPGVDDRHGPYVHDCGMWVQNKAGLNRVASQLHDALTNPTPVRAAQVQTTGRLRPGMKVALVERRPNGVVVTEHVVVARIAGSTLATDDAMTLTGIVTHREAVQTDPDGPPVDEHDDWTTQPPLLDPDPPRETDPPGDEDEPGQDNPPGTPPARPSAPWVTADLNVLTIRWAGTDVYGDDALSHPDYGTTEVALAAGPAPDDVVGWMEAHPDGGQRLVHGPLPLDSHWWVRIRVIDRWGTPSDWSDTAEITIDEYVDQQQFEDALARIAGAEEGLDELAAELAAGGHALTDPEFEDAAAWTVPPGSTWRTDLTGHPFHRSTGLTVPAGVSTVSSGELPAEAGQRWWLAVLVRADAATTSTTLGGLRVQWTGMSGATLTDVDVRPLRDFPVGEWVLLSGYAVAPEGATGARLQVRRTSSLAPAWTLGSARLLRASGGVADPVVVAGFAQFLRVNVGQLVVTEGATINEAVILRLAAELAEFITVRAENITAGTINVLLDLAANGGVTAGVLETGGRSFMRGGPSGGIGFEVPDRTNSGGTVEVAKFGRDWVGRNSDGDITASVTGEDGTFAGENGVFSTLTAGGYDVVEAIRGRAKLIVHEDTDDLPVDDNRGPFTQETGYRSWGFRAQEGHVYRVECVVSIIAAADAASGGTHFTYLRQNQSPTLSGPVTLGSRARASNDGPISAGAEGRFPMYYYYVCPPGGRDIRVGVSARRGGTAQGSGWRFVRAVFSVTDEGLYEPLVTSGRWDLMGAAGAPAPDPTPNPQRYDGVWDFDWHEVYQAAGRVNRSESGVGNNLRQGRVGSSASFPFASLVRVPDDMRSALMGSVKPRPVLRLTAAYGSGAVIVGYSTVAGSSSPSSFPTPVSPVSVGTIVAGETKEFALPSAWESAWQAGTIRSLTIGRLDSEGASDRLIDFRSIATSTAVRARLFATWEK